MTKRQLRAAGYFRISRENGRGDALEAPNIYKSQIAHHATELNCIHSPDSDTFADVNVSGGVNPLLRGGFDEWYRRNGEFDLLIVPTVARFSRDVESGTAVANRLHAEGIRVEFIDRRGLDRSSAIGRFTFTQDLAISQLQRDQARESWLQARINAARQGRPGGREAPFGYVHVPHGIPEVDEEAAAIVREIFERKAAGDTLHGMQTDLNRRAVPGPKGKSWSRSSLRRLILNRFYLGEQEVADEVFEGAWEPLVDRDTFEAANARLGERRGKRMSGIRYPLTGLLVCGVDGARMYFDSRPGPHPDRFYRCIECAQRIAADRAESIVDKAVEKKLRSRYVKRVLAAPDAAFESEGDAEEVARLEERLRLLQRRASSWLDDWADAPAPMRAPLRQKIEEASAEIEEIEARIRVLRATAESARIEVAALRELVAQLPEVLATLNPQEKNRFLSLVIERAVVVEPRNGRRADGRIGAGTGKDVEIEWVRLLRGGE
jgi:site-specific DNA recombinase